MEIKHYDTISETEKRCGEYLSQLITDKPTLLFYSGGSSLSVLPYLHLQSQRTQPIILAAVDERFDPINNNYLQLQQRVPQFFSADYTNILSIIDTHPNVSSLEEMADWYNQKVKEIIQLIKEQSGTIIVLLGMGEDGHIAGILPHPSEEKVFYDRFLDTERYVCGYNAGDKNQYTLRFTLTYPALLQASQIVVFMGGIKKKELLEKGISEKPSIHSFPGLYFSETPQPVTVFLGDK